MGCGFQSPAGDAQSNRGRKDDPFRSVGFAGGSASNFMPRRKRRPTSIIRGSCRYMKWGSTKGSTISRWALSMGAACRPKSSKGLAGPGGRRTGADGLRRGPIRPRAARDPPRPEAGQYSARSRRPAAGDRFWFGQAGLGRAWPDRHGTSLGHSQLYASGASRRQIRLRWAPRPTCIRLGAILYTCAHGSPTVSGGGQRRHVAPGSGEGTALAGRFITPAFRAIWKRSC